MWSRSGSSMRRGAMGAEVLEHDCVRVLATDRCAGRATFSSSISAWRHRIDPKLWWCLSKARGYLVVRCWSLGPAERGRLGGRSAVRNPNASAPRPFPRGGACRRECLLGLGLGSEGARSRRGGREVGGDAHALVGSSLQRHPRGVRCDGVNAAEHTKDRAHEGPRFVPTLGEGSFCFPTSHTGVVLGTLGCS